MTRKDYKLIAKAISDATAQLLPKQRDLDAVAGFRINVVYNLTKALQADNPRFNEYVFRTACYDWKVK